MAGTVRHRSLFAIVDVGVVATTSWSRRRTGECHLVPGAHTCPPQRGSVTPQWRWPTRSTPSGIARGPAEGKGPVRAPSARRAHATGVVATRERRPACHCSLRTSSDVRSTGRWIASCRPRHPWECASGSAGWSPASDSAWTVCPSPIDEADVEILPAPARSRSARGQEPHSVGSSTRAPWVCVTRCRRGPHCDHWSWGLEAWLGGTILAVLAAPAPRRWWSSGPRNDEPASLPVVAGVGLGVDAVGRGLGLAFPGVTAEFDPLLRR